MSEEPTGPADVNYRAILRFTLGLTILVLVSGALMWWLSISMRNQRIAVVFFPEVRHPVRV